MPISPAMGPVALCTLIAADGEAMAEAYTRWLHQQIIRQCPLENQTAAALGYPELAGQDSWLLANAAGREWLHIIDCPGASPRDALNCHGWMALELLVENVDELAASLENSPFELLRAPADLDVSDQIRACQVRGPGGEILYLTQVSGEVPPFELPRCEAAVDHLFIPVLSTPSRDRSLSEYATISGNEGICFNTRISVVNQARGFDLERRHPVATLQLAGRALIEIDQIADTPAAAPGLHSGVACVAFHCNRETADNLTPQTEGVFRGYRLSAHRGGAGEHFALIYA